MSSDIAPVLAIVPARGGSKGLPNKNVRPLAGLPLLVHSLRCASMCPEIARCIVSTDSATIADAARQHGGDVPFMRPAELARDDSPTMPVLAHALAEIEARSGTRFGSVVLLEPTSPGRLPEDVARAVALLASDPSADGVVACSRPSFNPYYVGVVEQDGIMAPAFPGARMVRRQGAKPFFRINGALFLWRRHFVATAPPTWQDGRHRILEIPEERAFSIDDLYEFRMAELAIENGVVELPWLGRSRHAEPSSETA